MKKKDLDQYKTRLTQIRRDLIGDVGAKKRDSQEPGDDGTQDIGDLAADIYSRQLMMDLGEKEREQLKLVDIALQKITNGDYGVCEECQSSIPAKRLKVVPYARLCVTCQNEAEKEKSI